MDVRYLLKFLVVYCICAFVFCQNTPTENFPHVAQLDDDGKMLLYWKLNETHITMELHGETTGWIGMGIASAPMTEADFFVGWVKSNNAIITDRFGLASDLPARDSQENIELLAASDCDGWTFVKIRRQLVACESNEDVNITAGTLRVSYVYSDTDPEGDDITAQEYAGAQRGSRDINLLGSVEVASNVTDLMEFNLTNNNLALPTNDTYYSCNLMQLPTVPSKRHIISFEPIIQEGNEEFIRHIIVYQCMDPLPVGREVGNFGLCFSDEAPIGDSQCSFVFAAWIKGGEIFRFPSDVGLSFGDADDSRFVVLQIHYDNPQEMSGITDSSGLRFFYTEQLRPNDAGVLLAGYTVNPFTLTIPPNQRSFTVNGDCTDNCLGSAMSDSNTTDINIFAVNFFTHSFSRAVALRHIRDETELEPISEDEAYDGDFQTARYIRPARTLLPGDSLQVTCEYSTSTRNTLISGGLSTRQSVCLSLIYYHPRLRISNCQTDIQVLELFRTLGLDGDDVTGNMFAGFFGSLNDLRQRSSGRSIPEVLDETFQNQSVVNLLRDVMVRTPRSQTCSGNGITARNASIITPPINITTSFDGPNAICTGQTTGFSSFRAAETCSSPAGGGGGGGSSDEEGSAVDSLGSSNVTSLNAAESAPTALSSTIATTSSAPGKQSEMHACLLAFTCICLLLTL